MAEHVILPEGVDVTPEQYEWVMAQAAARGIAPSEYLRELIRAGMEGREPFEGEEPSR